MAIAFSTAHGFANGTGTAVSLPNVQTTGDNRILFFTMLSGTSVLSVNPTFGGVTMTQLGTTENIADALPFVSCWYLVAPSTTSGSITATLNSSQNWRVSAVSYTGVWQEEPVGTSTQGTTTSSPLTIQRTSDANGSWMFATLEDAGQGGVTANSGCIVRQVVGADLGASLDSNATIANTVTHSLVVNITGSGQKCGYFGVMMRPVATVANTSNFFLVM